MPSAEPLTTRDVAVLGEHVIHLPDSGGTVLDQDAEWCEVEKAGVRRRIRFHDYAEIFRIPGLYEQLFAEQLRCCSPGVVRDLLAEALEGARRDPSELVVLDVGAGNGMVGEGLRELGVAAVVGVDILPEAAAATARDRPGVYEEFHVVDLTDPPRDTDAALRARGFTALTCVAALGFGDIPPAAFARAFDYLRDGGLIAFTIKERFTDEREDESGFSRLLRELERTGEMRRLVEHRYEHRLSVSGEPLHYVAYVAEKLPAGGGPGAGSPA